MSGPAITLEHLREALRRVQAGELPEGHGYDQGNWCGTSCCLWGHAHVVAGLPVEQAEGGPSQAWAGGDWRREIARGALRIACADRAQAVLAVALGAANLRGANLHGADLYGADLRKADLRKADLYGADLSEASLYGANLRGANLYGADLSGADLRGAYVSGGWAVPGWGEREGRAVRA